VVVRGGGDRGGGGGQDDMIITNHYTPYHFPYLWLSSLPLPPSSTPLVSTK